MLNKQQGIQMFPIVMIQSKQRHFLRQL